MSFSPGSLVRARGREWVVLSETGDLLRLRPLGGTDEEIAGLLTSLEEVAPAQFDLPDPEKVGDFRSARLLREAVRLGFRDSTGPFRSFARIAVEPRPYQLVPLLMALKQSPVRLLIADDVGIGKTIEAAAIAREIMDRGEADRLCVLCPPHLAEQWQRELRDKFHIEAELVLPSTVRRLERRCGLNQSLFDVYPHVIVSIDYIKADRRFEEFVRACPELVIVDEAHVCASDPDGRGVRQQRHRLLERLARSDERHLILVTATPHSGNEGAFRSLLGLLKPQFADLPADLAGPENEHHRRELARHLVQRRRADIRHYLEADTSFPDRKDREESYRLSKEYLKLFDRVLDYTREIVTDESGGQHHQRVRWWSMLALLRALASSPRAAEQTLRNRAASADSADAAEADEAGKRAVLDLDNEEEERLDVAPGADAGDFFSDAERNKRRLQDLARAASKLEGKSDTKLQDGIKYVRKLLADGYSPIIFCRFIPTAEYVAEYLRKALKGVEVAAVTGTLAPADREARVQALGEAQQRVLVSTDCLSEGVNLQDHFDAVVHYDLSWNPTRHEQREGRVDRFGQPSPEVRMLTYYGLDNRIDGAVLRVLLRKHKTIRSALGISVAVPADVDAVIEAISESIFTQSRDAEQQRLFPGEEDLHKDWDAAVEKEQRSRSMFAQVTIKPEEVARELAEARQALGDGEAASSFFAEAVARAGAIVTQLPEDTLQIDLNPVPTSLRDVLGQPLEFRSRFELPVPEGVQYLTRTHPRVSGLARWILDTAIDGDGAIATRSGGIRTAAVERRTTLLLMRFRFYLDTTSSSGTRRDLAEEIRILAFEGAPESATWLDEEGTQDLLVARPSGNFPEELARDHVGRIVAGWESLQQHLADVADKRKDELLEAHRRVRTAAKARGLRYDVMPIPPPDGLGIYVLLPGSAP